MKKRIKQNTPIQEANEILKLLNPAPSMGYYKTTKTCALYLCDKILSLKILPLDREYWIEVRKVIEEIEYR